jgi:CarD family transcriptional regulator
MMMFQIGEKVVYPSQGIGTIETISSRCFGAHPEWYYLLRLMCGRMTVMVPVSHAGEIGLRKITRNGELARVLSFLASRACASNQAWKDRFKENSEKMRVGGLLQITEVLKNLLVLQRHKPLSFREKRMLDRARHLLVTELGISRGLMEQQAAGLIQKSLSKAGLSLPPAM